MTDYLKFTILAEDKFSGVFDKLKGSIPSLGTVALAAGTAIVGLGAGLFAMTKSTANAYDEIRDLSNRLGVSTEELSKLKYAAELSGVGMDTLSLALKSVSNSVVSAASGSGAGADALKTLGISVKDILDLSPDQQFAVIADKLSGVGNASQKTALAMSLFGGRGTAVIQMLEKGSAGLEEMKTKAEKLGLVIGTKAANNADAFNDALTALKGSLTGLKNKLSEEIMPYLTGFFKGLTTYVIDNRDKIIQWGKEFLKVMESVLEKGMYVVAGLMDSWRGLSEIFNITKIAILELEKSFVWTHERIIAAAISVRKALNFDTSGLEKLQGSFQFGLGVIDEEIKKTQEHLSKLVNAPLAIAEVETMIEGIKKAMAKMKDAGTDKGSDKKKKGGGDTLFGDSEETKKNLKAIEDAYDEYFLTESEKIQKWYDEQLILAGDNEKAKMELFELYTAKNDNLLIDKNIKEKEALEELHALHDEYFLSESDKLDKWYAEEQRKFIGKEGALRELQQIYDREKKDLDNAKLEHEQEIVDAFTAMHDEYFGNESARLDAWYAEQYQKAQSSGEALALLDKVYADRKKKLEQKERQEKLKVTSEFLGNLATISSAFGQKGFKAAKDMAIAQALINTYASAVAAFLDMCQLGYPIGPILGAIAAAAAIATGLANVNRIRSQSYSAAAHGGMTNVPKESTYLLDQGERVLSPNQNKDLTAALKNGGIGGGTNIENVNIHVLENATNADSLLDISSSKWQGIVEEKIIPALKRARLAGLMEAA